jgi:DNA-binding transcriptional regulator YiaG
VKSFSSRGLLRRVVLERIPARIRRKLGLTQAQFTVRYGFSVSTVRSWE